MSKTKVVIDSTLYYPFTTKIKEELAFVPLTVNFSDATFKESENNHQTIDLIFEKVDQEKVLPKSSQPSPADFIQIYQKLIDEGATQIISLHLSSKISGTYQGATNAAQIVIEDNPEVEILVFDTQSVAQIGQDMALQIIELSKEKVITETIVNEIITKTLESSKIFFIVDNLDYLSYGGRIPSALAAVGNIFNVKPILKFDNGVIEKFKNVRSKKAALETVFQIIENDLEDNPKAKFSLYLPHVTTESDIKKVEKYIKKLDKRQQVTIKDTNRLGPVLAIHLGPGAIGICWEKK